VGGGFGEGGMSLRIVALDDYQGLVRVITGDLA
jgi:hypothetical protein